MLGRQSGGLLGPPRPYHKVRLFFSSPLVRSKVNFTRSEALSRAISVFKIFEFFREVSSSLPGAWCRRRRHVRSRWDKACGQNFVCKNTICRSEACSSAKEIGTQRNWHTKFSGPSPRGEAALCHANRAGKTLGAPSDPSVFPQKSAHKESAHKVFFRPLGRATNCLEKLCVPVLAQETPGKDT